MILYFEKAINLIKKSEKIAIACHINPDADGVGSALALAKAIKNSGRSADIFSADPIGERLSLLPGSGLIGIRSHSAYDLLILVDCNDRSRVGDAEKLAASCKTLIIDHHRCNECKADVSVIMTDISSACEIIYMLIEEWDERLFDKDIAENLFAGIITDTGGFSFPAVTERTHLAAAKLMSFGINSSGIFYEQIKKKSKNAFLLTSRVLLHAKFYSDDRICVISFFKKDFEETGADIFDCDGVVNELLKIDCVLISVAVTEADNAYKFSIRSKDYVDARDIAATFGGGGHRHASGCKLRGCYEEVMERMLKACSDRLR